MMCFIHVDSVMWHNEESHSNIKSGHHSMTIGKQPNNWINKDIKIIVNSAVPDNI